jgi:hypothetical protein
LRNGIDDNRFARLVEHFDGVIDNTGWPHAAFGWIEPVSDLYLVLRSDRASIHNEREKYQEDH